MAIHVQRRAFIGALGVAAIAWPHAVRAQKAPEVPRIDAHLNSIDAGKERHAWASLSTIL